MCNFKRFLLIIGIILLSTPAYSRVCFLGGGNDLDGDGIIDNQCLSGFIATSTNCPGYFSCEVPSKSAKACSEGGIKYYLPEECCSNSDLYVTCDTSAGYVCSGASCIGSDSAGNNLIYCEKDKCQCSSKYKFDCAEYGKIGVGESCNGLYAECQCDPNEFFICGPNATGYGKSCSQNGITYWQSCTCPSGGNWVSSANDCCNGFSDECTASNGDKKYKCNDNYTGADCMCGFTYQTGKPGCISGCTDTSYSYVGSDTHVVCSDAASLVDGIVCGNDCHCAVGYYNYQDLCSQQDTDFCTTLGYTDATCSGDWIACPFNSDAKKCIPDLSTGCAIGDVFYADGTCGNVADYDGSKNPVGVVYALSAEDGDVPYDTATAEKTKSPYGRVISLINAKSVEHYSGGAYFDNFYFGLSGTDIPGLTNYSSSMLLDAFKNNDAEIYSGKENSAKIIDTPSTNVNCTNGTYVEGANQYYAQYCDTPAVKVALEFYPSTISAANIFAGAGHWYLPAIGELALLQGLDVSKMEKASGTSGVTGTTKTIVNNTLTALKDKDVTIDLLANSYRLTSNEPDYSSGIYMIDFSNGNRIALPRTNHYFVRPSALFNLENATPGTETIECEYYDQASCETSISNSSCSKNSDGCFVISGCIDGYELYNNSSCHRICPEEDYPWAKSFTLDGTPTVDYSQYNATGINTESDECHGYRNTSPLTPKMYYYAELICKETFVYSKSSRKCVCGSGFTIVNGTCVEDEDDSSSSGGSLSNCVNGYDCTGACTTAGASSTMCWGVPSCTCKNGDIEACKPCTSQQ